MVGLLFSMACCCCCLAVSNPFSFPKKSSGWNSVTGVYIFSGTRVVWASRTTDGGELLPINVANSLAFSFEKLCRLIPPPPLSPFSPSLCLCLHLLGMNDVIHIICLFCRLSVWKKMPPLSFVNVRFTVEAGASLVFDMPLTKIGPNSGVSQFTSLLLYVLDCCLVAREGRPCISYEIDCATRYELLQSRPMTPPELRHMPLYHHATIAVVVLPMLLWPDAADAVVATCIR